MAISVRPFQDTDRTGVIDLWFRSLRRALSDVLPSTERMGQRFTADILPTCSVWVAEDDGAMVGFLSLRERDAFIAQLYVDPQNQSRGIGSTLIALARRRCPDGLSVATLQRNGHARAFYESQGFVEAGTGVNPGGQPTIVYRLHNSS